MISTVRFLSGALPAVLVVGNGIWAALRPEGMNLISSAGEAASQTVYHLHVHLLGGRSMGWPPG